MWNPIPRIAAARTATRRSSSASRAARRRHPPPRPRGRPPPPRGPEPTARPPPRADSWKTIAIRRRRRRGSRGVDVASPPPPAVRAASLGRHAARHRAAACVLVRGGGGRITSRASLCGGSAPRRLLAAARSRAPPRARGRRWRPAPASDDVWSGRDAAAAADDDDEPRPQSRPARRRCRRRRPARRSRCAPATPSAAAARAAAADEHRRWEPTAAAPAAAAIAAPASHGRCRRPRETSTLEVAAGCAPPPRLAAAAPHRRWAAAPRAPRRRRVPRRRHLRVPASQRGRRDLRPSGPPRAAPVATPPRLATRRIACPAAGGRHPCRATATPPPPSDLSGRFATPVGAARDVAAPAGMMARPGRPRGQHRRGDHRATRHTSSTAVTVTSRFARRPLTRTTTAEHAEHRARQRNAEIAGAHQLARRSAAPATAQLEGAAEGGRRSCCLPSFAALLPALQLSARWSSCQALAQPPCWRCARRPSGEATFGRVRGRQDSTELAPFDYSRAPRAFRCALSPLGNTLAAITPSNMRVPASCLPPASALGRAASDVRSMLPWSPAQALDRLVHRGPARPRAELVDALPRALGPSRARETLAAAAWPINFESSRALAGRTW